MTHTEELNAIWARADQRRDNGERAINCTAPAYSLSPGDGEITARAWLTEAEIQRVHLLGLRIQLAERIDAMSAGERIRAKIAQRRAA